MKTVRKIQLGLCALVFGAGLQFAPGAEAAWVNACWQACASQRTACLRSGDNPSVCWDEWTACIAECQ